MRLRWTPQGFADLSDAYSYIALDDPLAASQVLERIKQGVEHLRQFPEAGRPGRVEGTRELVITGTPYVVAYAVEGDEVQLLSVIHGRRKWPDRL